VAELRRMLPLMLSNKLAVKRINNLIDSVWGDTQSPASSYSALTTDGVILMTSGTATLYASTGNTSNQVYIKNIGAGSITISPLSGTIEGSASKVLSSQYDGARLFPDGSNWWVLP
jgi:hypothetical protein